MFRFPKQGAFPVHGFVLGRVGVAEVYNNTCVVIKVCDDLTSSIHINYRR